MQACKTVEEYIAQAPLDMQEKLRQMRKVIRTLAPDAREGISYGMPYYGYHGRLVYFAAMKGYIGLYIPPPIIADHKDDLAHYVTTKSAIHLPLTEDLPVKLITKLVKARMMHNEKHFMKK